MSFPGFDLGDLGSNALEEHINQLRDDAVSGADRITASVHDIRGHGSSEHGTVEATLGADATLVELSVDSRLLRKGTEAVTDAIKEAVNAAAADARTQVSESMTSGQPPVAASAEQDRDTLQAVVGQVLADVARAERRIR